MTREFLETVDNNVLCQRPSWRVDAAMVNPLCDSVLLISDHSLFPRGNNFTTPFCPLLLTMVLTCIYIARLVLISS